jgi:hypothetical protein
MKRNRRPVVAVRVEKAVHLRCQGLELVGQFGYRRHRCFELGPIQYGDVAGSGGVAVLPARHLPIPIPKCEHVGDDLLDRPVVARWSSQRVGAANQSIESLARHRDALTQFISGGLDNRDVFGVVHRRIPLL